MFGIWQKRFARRATWTAAILLPLLVAAVWFVTGQAVLRAVFLGRLPVVPAVLHGDEASVAFDVPSRADPALVKLGPPPTPVSVVSWCESRDAIALFLYESSADMRLLTVDKASQSVAEYDVPGSKLSYNPQYDRRDRHLIWIPGCLNASLYRFDHRTRAVEKVLTVSGESHIFGFDQHADGSLYLGTYPNRRCLHVTFEGQSPKITPVAVNVPAIDATRYLHGIFAAERSLYLHYMSPGALVRYDLDTGSGKLLMTTTSNQLSFSVANDRLRVSNGQETLVVDRTGNLLADRALSAQPRTRVGSGSNHHGTVSWEGGAAEFSLLARRDGMSITCLVAGEDGRLYGGTYWNHWLFAIDPHALTMTGIGPVPGASGEFFTAAWYRDELAIPHYQGALYLYDPGRPYSADPGKQNPRLQLKVPQAHFGLACLEDHSGRLIYATTPNYHQESGMLVVYNPDGTHRVHGPLGDGLTLTHLVESGGRVYAATVRRRGLGVVDPKHSKQRPRLVRVSVDSGAVEDEVILADRPGAEVRGLIAASESRLLCITDRKLHTVDVGSDSMRTETVPGFRRFGRIIGGKGRALLRYGPDRNLILTETLLMVWDDTTGNVGVLAKLPREMGHLVADRSGNLWMADEYIVYLLPRAAVMRLLADAGFD